MVVSWCTTDNVTGNNRKDFPAIPSNNVLPNYAGSVLQKTDPKMFASFLLAFLGLGNLNPACESIFVDGCGEIFT